MSKKSPKPLASEESPDYSTPKKVIVESKFTTLDVQKSDVTPPTTQKMYMIFNCPICMRYLSTILVGKCCGNYICHMCVDDLQKDHLSFDVSCPHCKAEPLHAVDVDPLLSVKRYSDSPYGTFKLNPGVANQMNVLPVVNEDDFDNYKGLDELESNH